MITNRYAFVAAAIVATFLLTGCQTAQKSGSTVSTAPSAKAEAPKDTETVKGINDWEGEISGKPAPGSKFTKLRIGMSMKQVTDLVGQPTDQGTYITGKAWIPYYYGSDR
jgi:outer membrane protein assembly factor BamE (lipoprotein component of BamABCDE complex)